jgi:Ala-tRNA(Pro) deacylase
MAMAPTVKSYLDQHGVNYELVPHPRTYSSKQTAHAAHVKDDHIAKAVLLTNDAGLVMAVIPGNGYLKIHAVQQELDRELELADETTVDKIFTDCQPGAIPPLGPAYSIEAVVDEALASLAYIYLESGDHETLVRISSEDFHQLLAGARHGYFSHGE